jgi:hypothetical protein
MPSETPTRAHLRLISAREKILEPTWGDVPKLYNHALLCSVGLPHKNPGDSVRSYQKSSGAVSLQLTAGSIPRPGDGFQDVGLPYGAKARLVLLELSSRAVMTQSPIVEIEYSFTAFARSMGFSTSGRSLNLLRQQVVRMSVVTMRLSKSQGRYKDTFQGTVFSKFRAELPSDHAQTTLFPSFVEFSPIFYESLINHAVPILREAIIALKASSRGLDIYCWLAHRLYRLNKPATVRWTSLRFQFGSRDQNMKSFKRNFKIALRQVLYVYPEARVDIVSGGLCLHPSKPPVSLTERKLLV